MCEEVSAKVRYCPIFALYSMYVHAQMHIDWLAILPLSLTCDSAMGPFADDMPQHTLAS